MKWRQYRWDLWVPVEQIVEAIKHGVRKVNIDTDLRLASTGAILKIPRWKPSRVWPAQIFCQTIDAMKAVCIDRYTAFGTAGNADKIRPISLKKMVSFYN